MKQMLQLVILLLTFGVTHQTSAAEKFLLIDILVLKQGKTLQDAKAYFSAVEPIFEKYQLYRTDDVLDVMQIARGDINAQVINLWETPDPQGAFKGIFSDKSYEKYVSLRDEIFDMKKATVVVTERK